jgi:predicted DNA-binding transcriptional regulator YafY
MNIKRLLIIDRCLRDRSRQWSLDDLIEACSSTEKNSRRSVQADLELMRSAERGYSAPIVVVDKKYYIYKDENYSLVEQGLTELDRKNLEAALETIRDYCAFARMEKIGGKLFDLHCQIAECADMERPELFGGKNIEPTMVRLWVDYERAEGILRNPLHQSQRLEQEEIDGSVNILLNIPLTSEFEAYLVKNHKQIMVTSPTSLAHKVKKLVEG